MVFEIASSREYSTSDECTDSTSSSTSASSASAPAALLAPFTCGSGALCSGLGPTPFFLFFFFLDLGVVGAELEHTSVVRQKPGQWVGALVL